VLLGSGQVNLWVLFPRTYFFLQCVPDTFPRKTFSDRLRTPQNPIRVGVNLLFVSDFFFTIGVIDALMRARRLMAWPASTGEGFRVSPVRLIRFPAQ